MRAPYIPYLTDIYFGFGSVGVVPGLLARFGVHRPLVVTDAKLIELGMVERLGIGAPETFADTETSPTEANLLACLATQLRRMRSPNATRALSHPIERPPLRRPTASGRTRRSPTRHRCGYALPDQEAERGSSLSHLQQHAVIARIANRTAEHEYAEPQVHDVER